jgi:hypothetical protein
MGAKNGGEIEAIDEKVLVFLRCVEKGLRNELFMEENINNLNFLEQLENETLIFVDQTEK